MLLSMFFIMFHVFNIVFEILLMMSVHGRAFENSSMSEQRNFEISSKQLFDNTFYF